MEKYIYPLVSKVHAGFFRVSVIHRTMTWTTVYLTRVRDHSYACVYTRGWGTPTASQHNIFDSEKLSILCVCSGRGSNLGSWNPLDLEADALPIESPRHPIQPHITQLLPFVTHLLTSGTDRQPTSPSCFPLSPTSLLHRRTDNPTSLT